MNTDEINWGPGLFLIFYHVALFVMLPVYLYQYGSPSTAVWVTTLAVFLLCGFSVTAGYHRYYAHRAYTPSRPLEMLLLFFGTIATEGSVLEWAHDHRRHHKHVDTEKDPYNIQQGFWYAHMLWLFEKPNRDFDRIKDLKDNKLLQFQHNHYSALNLGLNGAITVGCGLLASDILGAIVFLYLLRMFTLHHATWFINSLAHTWGVKPFSKEQSAVNNFIIALLTFGEGYHNYHHAFASDYRNGVRWYQFDPTKLFIWLFGKLGLAHDLNRIDDAVIRKRMIKEDRKLMLKHLEGAKVDEEESWEEKVNNLYNSMEEKLQELRNISDSEKVQEIKEQFHEEWRSWTDLCDQVLSLQTSTPAQHNH